jgi:hypothetical protein
MHKNGGWTFDIESGGLAPLNYQWDYGDGSTGTQASHIYVGAAHGQQFPVTLTVTDSVQCVSVVTQTLTIAQRLMPQFTFKVSRRQSDLRDKRGAPGLDSKRFPDKALIALQQEKQIEGSFTAMFWRQLSIM